MFRKESVSPTTPSTHHRPLSYHSRPQPGTNGCIQFCVCTARHVSVGACGCLYTGLQVCVTVCVYGCTATCLPMCLSGNVYHLCACSCVMLENNNAFSPGLHSNDDSSLTPKPKGKTSSRSNCSALIDTSTLGPASPTASKY